jgi:hypothetical protein
MLGNINQTSACARITAYAWTGVLGRVARLMSCDVETVFYRKVGVIPPNSGRDSCHWTSGPSSVASEYRPGFRRRQLRLFLSDICVDLLRLVANEASLSAADFRCCLADVSISGLC